jgi:hypothetical protein
MAAVATKNMTIKFIADLSKWKPALQSVKKDIQSLSKMVISPKVSMPNIPSVRPNRPLMGGGKQAATPSMPSPQGGGLSSLAQQIELGGGSGVASILETASAFKSLASPVAYATAAIVGFTAAMSKVIARNRKTSDSNV